MNKRVNICVMALVVIANMLGLGIYSGSKPTDEPKESSAGFYWPGESLPCPESGCEPIYPTEDDLANVDYSKQKEENEKFTEENNTPALQSSSGSITVGFIVETPSQDKIESDARKATNFVTYGEYEMTILGTCPSERQANAWERHSRLNAIGIVTSGTNKTTPLNSMEADIESLWEMYMESGPVLGDRVSRAEGFYFIWSTLTVENTKQPAKAAELTVYLRSLDSRYKAKCPND